MRKAAYAFAKENLAIEKVGMQYRDFILEDGACHLDEADLDRVAACYQKETVEDRELMVDTLCYIQ